MSVSVSMLYRILPNVQIPNLVLTGTAGRRDG